MNAFETMRAIRDLRDVPGAHKAVLYAMVLRTDNDTGECWPSYPTLAADAGISLAAAKRAVRELESAGHITVCRRRVDGTAWSQVNRYVVHVRGNVVSVRDDVVPERDDVVQERQDRDVVSEGDDVVSPRHDGGVTLTRGVVSPRHDGGVALTRGVVSPRHDGGVALTRGVVSPRHDGGVRVIPDLPNELPNGRSFALTRPDEPTETANGRPKKSPKHAPELIAAKSAIVDEFILCCETKKGSRPKKVHERDHAAAFALAKTYGANEGRSIVRRAFEDDFVTTKNTTIAFIESKAETYRGNAAPNRSGRREVQGLVGDEPWLQEHRS
jgi:helix-turn-helix protein